MHEIRFIGNYSAAIVEEPECHNGVREAGLKHLRIQLQG